MDPGAGIVSASATPSSFCFLRSARSDSASVVCLPTVRPRTSRTSITEYAWPPTMPRAASPQSVAQPMGNCAEAYERSRAQVASSSIPRRRRVSVGHPVRSSSPSEIHPPLMAWYDPCALACAFSTSGTHSWFPEAREYAGWNSSSSASAFRFRDPAAFAPRSTCVSTPRTGRRGSTTTPRHLPSRNSRRKYAPATCARAATASPAARDSPRVASTRRSTRSALSAITASALRSQQSPTAPCRTSQGRNLGAPERVSDVSRNRGGSNRRHRVARARSDEGASSAHAKKEQPSFSFSFRWFCVFSFANRETRRVPHA